MTRSEMKQKILRLVSEAHRVGMENGKGNFHADCCEADNLEQEILAQIDLMYQGAADDETFDNCSYCGEPIATDPMTHKDGDCLEAKILLRD